MFRGSVLLSALLFSMPVIWQALWIQTVGVDVALERYLVAVPIAAVLIAGVRAAMRPVPPSRTSQSRSATPSR